MKSLEEKFGDLLKELRSKKGLTQNEFAKRCSLDRTFISMLERGLRQPTITTLFKIAKVLDVSPSSIVKQLEH
jgi:transcriptional regulator with XRE-family HTH domain